MKKLLLIGMMMIGVLSAGEWSRVEKEFVKGSVHQGVYPSEKIRVVEVKDYDELGQLVALRFLEWVRGNPNGVVSLPTGRTPEMFIEHLKYLKAHWHSAEVQEKLQWYGMSGPLPDTSRLKFVQIDEFYPIDPEHANSFRNYVQKHYLSLLGIEKENALLMDINEKGILSEKGVKGVFPDGKVDLGLLRRQPKNALEQWQKQALQEAQVFAKEYEKKIREWGGIGFFLGGVGIDGHIAFISPGTSPKSSTHLAELTYIEAAQSAVALGGISNISGVAMTIGMDTIMSNEESTLIIMAAGEGKAPAVRDAVEGPQTVDFPASLMQGTGRTRFYVTKGAAKELTDRKVEDAETLPITNGMVDEVIIAIALGKKKTIRKLTAADMTHDRRGAVLVRRLGMKPEELIAIVAGNLEEKIERGINLPKGKRILHTGPHHDDVMLSYFGVLPKILGENGNIFVYLTSGFNSVTDAYMKRILETVISTDFDSYDALESPYALVLARALRAARSGDQEAQDTYEATILMRHIGIVYGDKTLPAIRKRANWLLNHYFAQKTPGEKDSPQVQTLKGAMRESEEDRLMTVMGVPVRDVIHMRSKFYTGDYFSPKPTIANDAKPFQEVIESFKPDVITVALDPEGTGPDTHYKVLQVVAQAVSLSNLKPTIWGYRNVWHRFPIAETDMAVPVSEKELQELNDCFLTCYTTQKTADYPPLEHNGTFAELSVIIQRDQLMQMKTLLGEGYFQQHPDERIRNAAGFVFLQIPNFSINSEF